MLVLSNNKSDNKSNKRVMLCYVIKIKYKNQNKNLSLDGLELVLFL